MPTAETKDELTKRYSEELAALRAACEAAGAQQQLLDLMSSHLANQDSLCDRSDAPSLEALVRLADQVVALVDRVELAAAFGVIIDKDDTAQAKQHKQDEAKKKSLVSALHIKALALADLHAVDPATHALARLDEALVDLHQWAAPSEHVKATCRWHKAHGRAASALAALSQSLEKDKVPPSKESLELQISLMEALGWAHCAIAAKSGLLVKFPAAYPLVFSKLD